MTRTHILFALLVAALSGCHSTSNVVTPREITWSSDSSLKRMGVVRVSMSAPKNKTPCFKPTKDEFRSQFSNRDEIEIIGRRKDDGTPLVEVAEGKDYLAHHLEEQTNRLGGAPNCWTEVWIFNSDIMEDFARGPVSEAQISKVFIVRTRNNGHKVLNRETLLAQQSPWFRMWVRHFKRH